MTQSKLTIDEQKDIAATNCARIIGYLQSYLSYAADSIDKKYYNQKNVEAMKLTIATTQFIWESRYKQLWDMDEVRIMLSKKENIISA